MIPLNKWHIREYSTPWFDYPIEVKQRFFRILYMFQDCYGYYSVDRVIFERQVHRIGNNMDIFMPFDIHVYDIFM